jgi:hypothetical protein
MRVARDVSALMGVQEVTSATGGTEPAGEGNENENNQTDTGFCA